VTRDVGEAELHLEKRHLAQSRLVQIGTKAVYLCRERFALQAHRWENHLHSELGVKS
jgi:hypothetical protein